MRPSGVNLKISDFFLALLKNCYHPSADCRRMYMFLDIEITWKKGKLIFVCGNDCNHDGLLGG